MDFSHWIKSRQLNESNSRYSVEINYRTKTKEVLEAFAKIALGYVSASLKKQNYHVKQVFDESPIRIMISSRNWDDGEWVGMIIYKPDEKSGCFVISNGFYNKDRKTISIQRSQKCKNDSPAELTKEIVNMMYGLKNKKDRHQEPLKPINLKRGPKN